MQVQFPLSDLIHLNFDEYDFISLADIADVEIVQSLTDGIEIFQYRIFLDDNQSINLCLYTLIGLIEMDLLKRECSGKGKVEVLEEMVVSYEDGYILIHSGGYKVCNKYC